MDHKTSPLLLTLFLFTATTAVRAATVTTVDNASPPNDGQTSLLEALTNVQDNETISFNIPGAGPHYILTPVTGYPLIQKKGVTIDGYSQPGSSPNTAAPDQPRNTQIRIILDSRTPEPAERRTVLNYPGFGTAESCVLGFLDAPDAAVRGLSFVGVAGHDSSTDPYVYCIALVRESPRAKIQGCWFGLDAGLNSWTPDADGVVAGVAGAKAAVASFYATGSGNSRSLTFGTDGDGQGDRGEGNVCVAQRIAVHIQTPQTVMAGNWINLFPDGSLLNLEKQGLDLEDGTLEALENGDATDMRVGTNGDGLSDAEESNRFGPVVYHCFLQFYKSAYNIVCAGNYVGMGLDGMPAFTSPDIPLAEIREKSSIRIGYKGSASEANHIYGIISSFLSLKGSPTRVSLRGNEISGCKGAIPYSDSTPAAALPEKLFADILTDPSNTAVTLDPASTPAQVAGTFPVPAAGINPPVIDLYLADAYGLQDPEGPFPQGRSWLGSFIADGPADLDGAAGQFKFNTSSLALTAAELGQLTATATYSINVSVNGVSTPMGVTTNFSGTLITPPAAAPLGELTITGTAQPGSYSLNWTGGLGPFRVLSSSSPAGPWSTHSTVPGQSLTITPDTVTVPRQFYRVKEGAAPR